MRTDRRKLLAKTKYEVLDCLYTNGGYVDTGFPEGNYIFHIKFSAPSFVPWSFRFMSSGLATGDKDRFYSGINGSETTKTFIQGCGAVFENINLNKMLLTEPHGIYDGNKLLRDFIPVRRRSDGKIGLLDKVENKFYTSSNGIEFTKS